MDLLNKNSQVNSFSLVFALSETLKRIDSRLMDHGERVAYLAETLYKNSNLQLEEDSIFLLAVFHDIGAYKTDEIDKMIEFETIDFMNHSVYGYLFLKYMSPLAEKAEAILYHHASCKKLSGLSEEIKNYSQLIHLADRIDIAFQCGIDSKEFENLWNNTQGLFKNDFMEAFHKSFTEDNIYENIKNANYKSINLEKLKEFNISIEQAISYLKMIVYSIDFRSEHTVTHSINTISISLDIARHFNLPTP